MREGQDDTIPNLPALGRALSWVDKPRSGAMIVYGLLALCAGLFLADFLYHKHPYFEIEELPGFYGIYGFIVCVALVLCARGLGHFLKRDARYYAPNDIDAEEMPEDQMSRPEPGEGARHG